MALSMEGAALSLEGTEAAPRRNGGYALSNEGFGLKELEDLSLIRQRRSLSNASFLPPPVPFLHECAVPCPYATMPDRHPDPCGVPG
jgi:hypothetical protein